MVVKWVWALERKNKFVQLLLGVLHEILFQDALNFICISYLYYCLFSNRIDASDRKYICRYINDSQSDYNLLAKPIIVEEKQHIVFYAARNIAAEEELAYDYGGGPYLWRYLHFVWLLSDISAHTTIFWIYKYCHTGGSNQQSSIFDHPACFGYFLQ